MTSSALLLAVCVAGFTSLVYAEGPGDNELPSWRTLLSNGTYVTRDWRKSITTRLVLVPTKRPDLASTSTPKPTERSVMTKPTPHKDNPPAGSTRITTTIGNIIRRRSVTPSSTPNTVTATAATSNKRPQSPKPGTSDSDTHTAAPKLETADKEDKGASSPNDLSAVNAAPAVHVCTALTIHVIAVLLAWVTY